MILRYVLLLYTAEMTLVCLIVYCCDNPHWLELALPKMQIPGDLVRASCSGSKGLSCFAPDGAPQIPPLTWNWICVFVIIEVPASIVLILS